MDYLAVHIGGVPNSSAARLRHNPSTPSARVYSRCMAATARKTPSADVTKVRRGQIQQMRTTAATPSTSFRAAVERRAKASGK